MTPVEKLKLAMQVTAVVDTALTEEKDASEVGAEVLVLALKARVSMDQLRATFRADCGASACGGYSSL